MKRLAGILRPGTLLFAAALFAAAAPLSAQQAVSPPPATEAATQPANVPAEPLPGPRVREEWQRVEPNINNENRESRLMHKSNQTITVSTLVLVLAVVILVLLIA